MCLRNSKAEDVRVFFAQKEQDSQYSRRVEERGVSDQRRHSLIGSRVVDEDKDSLYFYGEGFQQPRNEAGAVFSELLSCSPAAQGEQIEEGLHRKEGHRNDQCRQVTRGQMKIRLTYHMAAELADGYPCPPSTLLAQSRSPGIVDNTKLAGF
ncbi:hypothetical protein P7K49_036365 [Saguinus oedipus]|uniref:Uncharacterized protein n=1 Tax=Saguinus oedipus TaxID=9490 RepID=A0ABQ9TKG6_SAGOE|nr:hypothetical protein P7K49_036365 [Saguinus oedipus]